jgi:hypothetical protein
MGLIIPHSHAIHQKPPKYACTLCPMVFTEDERRQFEHHVIRGHSIEDLREHSPQAQAPAIFDPHWEGGDTEWGAWIERNARAGNDPMRYMRTDDGKSGGGVGDG